MKRFEIRKLYQQVPENNGVIILQAEVSFSFLLRSEAGRKKWASLCPQAKSNKTSQNSTVNKE